MQPLHGAALSGPPYSSVLWFPAAVLQLLRLVGGHQGVDDAVKSLKKALDPYLFTKIMDDYLTNIRDRITDTYDGKRDRHIMIRGINQFAD